MQLYLSKKFNNFNDISIYTFLKNTISNYLLKKKQKKYKINRNKKEI